MRRRNAARSGWARVEPRSFAASTMTLREGTNMTEDNEAPAWAADEGETIEGLRRELGTIRHQLTNAQEELSSATASMTVKNNRIMELEGLNRAAELARTRLVDDIRAICDDLLDEAERREWCSDYEEFANRVNARLTQHWLKMPEREHQYRYVVAVTIDHRNGDAAQVHEDITGALEGIGEHISASYSNLTIDVDRQR